MNVITCFGVAVSTHNTLLSRKVDTILYTVHEQRDSRTVVTHSMPSSLRTSAPNPDRAAGRGVLNAGRDVSGTHAKCRGVPRGPAPVRRRAEQWPLRAPALASARGGSAPGTSPGGQAVETAPWPSLAPRSACQKCTRRRRGRGRCGRGGAGSVFSSEDVHVQGK